MFAIPSLPEIVTRTAGSFRAYMKGSDAVLYPNNVAVSAKVIAGAVWEAFAFLGFISRQSIKHLAEGQFLELHCKDYGLSRHAPTYATGYATLMGDIGVVVPSGLTLNRLDGIQYTTGSGGTTDGFGKLKVSLTATAPGKAANAEPGQVLELAAPFTGLSGDAEVADEGIGLGADLESDASLRDRLLYRLRNPPMGGSAADYVTWARDVNGVTRVWVDKITPDNGRTTVGVWFTMDDLYDTGIPQPADVAAVYAYIDTKRPAGARVDITAPGPLPVNITIANLAVDSVDVRAAILTELRRLFSVGMDVSTINEPQMVWRSQIEEAISVATGEKRHTLVAPAADIAIPTGQLPILGEIIYA